PSGRVLPVLLSGSLPDGLGSRGPLTVSVPLAALGLIVAVWVLRDRRSVRVHPSPATAGVTESTLASLRRLDRRLLAPAYVAFVIHFAGRGVVMATLGFQLKLLAAEAGSAA